MEKWVPPSLKAYTGAWTVDPWLSQRYEQYASRESAVMRSAALGLLYEHFRPIKDEDERSAYYKAAKDPDYNVRILVFRTVANLPLAFRRRLRCEIVGEVRSMHAWLDRLEAESFPSNEVEAYLEARNILDYATMPLQADGSYYRQCGVLRALDAEAEKRLPHKG